MDPLFPGHCGKRGGEESWEAGTGQQPDGGGSWRRTGPGGRTEVRIGKGLLPVWVSLRSLVCRRG